MSNALYVVAVNGHGSLIFGKPDRDGRQTGISGMRRKDAKKMAENWPASGLVIVYKLVPVENHWHDPKGSGS
jgi:hypothetical protein